MEEKLKKTREILHDLVNSLAIAKGMAETVKRAMEGKATLSPEDQLLKLDKSINALKKLESQVIELREVIKSLQVL